MMALGTMMPLGTRTDGAATPALRNLSGRLNVEEPAPERALERSDHFAWSMAGHGTARHEARCFLRGLCTFSVVVWMFYHCNVIVPKPTLSPFARGYLSLCQFFTAAVWCVPALRVPLVHSLINHFRQNAKIERGDSAGHGGGGG